MVMKEIAPLRVWLFAMVMLAMLAIVGSTLVLVLDDPFTFLLTVRVFAPSAVR
jgi:hypothetical protein